MRLRAGSIVGGSADAAGLVRSPYTVDGKSRLFAEPPLLQATMLFLTAGVAVPPVGHAVEVRVRFTATDADSVISY